MDQVLCAFENRQQRLIGTAQLFPEIDMIPGFGEPIPISTLIQGCRSETCYDGDRRPQLSHGRR